MTLTVKLDPELEQRLRQRSAAMGRTASDVVRAALEAYLQETAAPRHAPSPYTLGAHLFGRHRGRADLASQRKTILAEVWVEARADARAAAPAEKARRR